MARNWSLVCITTFVALCLWSFNISAHQLDNHSVRSSNGNLAKSSAATPLGQLSYLGSRISLRAANINLGEFLKKIASKTGVRFSYNRKVFPFEKKVNISVDHSRLLNVLNQGFEGMRLSWTALKGKHIVIAERSGTSQWGGDIRGKVLDANTGDPLPGAIVLLKGTSMGASTDLEGNYSIRDVPLGSYLVRVSYIGYVSRVIFVQLAKGGKLTEDLKLRPVGVKGKAVVVTAQASGQAQAINQELSSDKIMNAVSAAKIRQLPDENAAESVGRLPGVFVLRKGG